MRVLTLESRHPCNRKTWKIDHNRGHYPNEQEQVDEIHNTPFVLYRQRLVSVEKNFVCCALPLRTITYGELKGES